MPSTWNWSCNKVNQLSITIYLLGVRTYWAEIDGSRDHGLLSIWIECCRGELLYWTNLPVILKLKCTKMLSAVIIMDVCLEVGLSKLAASPRWDRDVLKWHFTSQSVRRVFQSGFVGDRNGPVFFSLLRRNGVRKPIRFRSFRSFYQNFIFFSPVFHEMDEKTIVCMDEKWNSIQKFGWMWKFLTQNELHCYYHSMTNLQNLIKKPWYFNDHATLAGWHSNFSLCHKPTKI